MYTPICLGLCNSKTKWSLRQWYWSINPHHIPAGVLSAFKPIVPYKSYLLPPLIFALTFILTWECFTYALSFLKCNNWCHSCLYCLAEAGLVTTANSGRFCILTTSLPAQSGGIQPMFRHVKLRGATVSHVSSQLWTFGSCPGSSPGPCPPSAEQGLGPGGLRWERWSTALSALRTQRPHQMECGGGLWVHSFTTRWVGFAKKAQS